MSNEKQPEKGIYFEDAQKIEDLLNALGITASYLAKKVDVTHGAIYHIKYGKNALSNEMIDKIVAAYPNVNYKFLKHKQLPVLLDDAGVKLQMERLNLPSNQTVSVDSLGRFISIPIQLDRLEEKLDLIMQKMDIEFYDLDK